MDGKRRKSEMVRFTDPRKRGNYDIHKAFEATKDPENRKKAILRALQEYDPKENGKRKWGTFYPQEKGRYIEIDFSYKDIVDLERDGLLEIHSQLDEDGKKLRAQYYHRRNRSGLYTLQATNPTELKKVYEITPEGTKYLARHQRDKRHSPKGTDLVGKVSSFIFLLAGLVFMTIPDLTTTGNVTGNSAGANLSFFLSSGLMVIGGVLFFISFKK